MADPLKFCFEIEPVADVDPWGEPGEAKLHWFGLTSGLYWIATPAGEILRYTEDSEGQRMAFPVRGYQVARMFEDLQECLPAVLEPVPEDIVEIVSNRDWRYKISSWIERDREDRDEEWDLYNSAISWWSVRQIDTPHLRHAPHFSQ